MASSDGLDRAIPESCGVSSKDIRAFLDDATTNKVELNSFMLYRSGKVIAESWWWPYQPDLPHMLHSATKSFLAVAVGMAIHEEFFRLEDRVVSFFPEHVPANPSPGLLVMTVEDLLTQTSGHGMGHSGGEWRGIEGSWIAKFFETPVEHQPGLKFVYSSATSFMLSAIVTKTTGLSARDFLEPRLFRPLGIKMLTWDAGPENVNPGGNGISCCSSDFLKLGILHLQEGVWNGQQILPKAWVRASTTSQRGNQYGYHWWTGAGAVYRANGMFGQFVVVFPEHDAVLLTTAAVGRGSLPLNDVIERHFPRMFAPTQEVAPALDVSEPYVSLKELLATQRLLPLFKDLPSTPVPPQALSVVSRERFVAKSNEDGIVSFTLDFQAQHCILHLEDGRGFQRVKVGLEDWVEGETSLSGAKLHHGYESAQMRGIAGGRWTNEYTFEIIIQFNETAFRDTIKITYLPDYQSAKLDRSVNVNSFSTKRPTIWASILITGDELSKGLGDNSKNQFSISGSSVGELLDNPMSRAILEEEIPHVVSDSRLEKAKMYTFEMLGHRLPGVGPDTLDRINARLLAL